MDPMIAKRVELTMDSSKKLMVKIANGDIIECVGSCNSLTVALEGHLFKFKACLLPLDYHWEIVKWYLGCSG